MTSSSFPSKLADLALNDSTHNSSLYASLKSIRRSALSIPNRLRSILADAQFVKEVSDYYKLPLIANERCGSWYIEPTDKLGSTYFKSTDGHHGQWDFSRRRLNLQLLPVLGDYGGAVVVDSTRRGKNLPDAFSKTVPIWVAVINRALFPELPSLHQLQTPPAPNDLGQSEIAQIEAKLDGFVACWTDLGLDLGNLRNVLKRPIRVTWAINGRFEAGSGDYSDQETLTPLECPSHRLVLCSASRRVRGAEISEGGYIQGAGDDSEGWSHGLTPQAFWKHKEVLMQSHEDELHQLIQQLLKKDEISGHTSKQITKISPTSNLHIGIGPVEIVHGFDLVLNCQNKGCGTSANVVNLGCRLGKLGSKDLRNKLSIVSQIVGNELLKNDQSQVLVTCATGKDLSAGVAVALLCLFYNDEGEF